MGQFETDPVAFCPTHSRCGVSFRFADYPATWIRKRCGVRQDLSWPHPANFCDGDFTGSMSRRHLWTATPSRARSPISISGWARSNRNGRRPGRGGWEAGNSCNCYAVQYSMHRFTAAGMLIFTAAQAGNIIKPLSADALAEAPAVVVCRVERISAGAFVPAKKGARPAATRRCTASLRVLRAVPEFKAARIYLNYYCHGPNAVMVNGHPAFPNLEPSRTYVLPLAPDGDRWKLIANEGWGLVVPAVDTEPTGNRPASKREFIVQEIMNTLLHGAYLDLYRFSLYMQFRQAAELNDEIMAGLVAALQRGDPRWLDISTALLANTGVPRRKLDYLATSGPPHGIFPDAVQSLAARTLREAPERRRREDIVRNMLQHSAIHVWGTAATLVPEFKDDPLLLKLLPAYLEQPQKGAVATACSLVANGQIALLDVTLEAALKVLRDRGVDFSEVYPTCKLLIQHGSDEQFEEYLTILKEAKVHDAKRYHQLWQVAWGERSPRVMRILAVLLNDQRRASPWYDVRNCDFAGALLQRFSGEKFGFKQWEKMPLPERNVAVARARAWMKQAPSGAR